MVSSMERSLVPFWPQTAKAESQSCPLPHFILWTKQIDGFGPQLQWINIHIPSCHQNWCYNVILSRRSRGELAEKLNCVCKPRRKDKNRLTGWPKKKSHPISMADSELLLQDSWQSKLTFQKNLPLGGLLRQWTVQKMQYLLAAMQLTDPSCKWCLDCCNLLNQSVLWKIS